MGIGDWGLGIGDWGWGLGPIPNPQSPIPNPHPQSPSHIHSINPKLNLNKILNLKNKKKCQLITT